MICASSSPSAGSRAEVLGDGFTEAYYGIADAHRVIKGLINNSRLEAQSAAQALSVPPAVFAAGENPAAPNKSNPISGAGTCYPS